MSPFEQFLNQFSDDFEACHSVVTGKDFTLETVEDILKQKPTESDAAFAGRCMGIFHAYAFAAGNFAKFQKLGFITPESQITSEMMFALYLFFGCTETPPHPNNVQMDLFVKAVRQRQSKK